MNHLIILGISFGVLILSVVIYLRNEDTHWKELKAALLPSNTKSAEALKTAIATQDSVIQHKLATRECIDQFKKNNEVMRKEIDDLHEHFRGLSQPHNLLRSEYNQLKDKVQGFSINLPQQIAITLTKDVKSAIRNKPKGRSSRVKNSKAKRSKT